MNNQEIRRGVRAIPYFYDDEGDIKIIIGEGRNAVKLIGGSVGVGEHNDFKIDQTFPFEVMDETGVYPKNSIVLGDFDEEVTGDSEREIALKGVLFRNRFYMFELSEKQREWMEPNDDVLRFYEVYPEEAAEYFSYESTRIVWEKFVLPAFLAQFE